MFHKVTWLKRTQKVLIKNIQSDSVCGFDNPLIHATIHLYQQNNNPNLQNFYYTQRLLFIININYPVDKFC